MKKLILGLLMMFTFGVTQAQDTYVPKFFGWNQNEETFMSVWIDPTFTDVGEQYGVEITKELNWGWVSGSFSRYEALTPTYTDLVASGGINFHLFRYERIKYYVGFRGGFIWRGAAPNGEYDISRHGLVGVVGGFDFKIIDEIRVGARLWEDYRSDLDEEKFGGEDDTQFRLNGGLVLIFRIND